MSTEVAVNPSCGSAYLAAALAQVPRLLSALDREPNSASSGSFDREHWGWKFRDFPLTMLQIGFYPLALLWRHPMPGNPNCGKEPLLHWVCGAMRATLARQHRNGAFDSVGPFTQDHGVTLAMVYYLCETARVLGDDLSPELRRRLPEAVRRACAFARAASEDYAFISNHHALFALAWLNAAELTGDGEAATRAQGAIDGILRNQSPDGWYAEYGGPDPGYESLGIHHLALYYRRTRFAPLLESLRRSIEFLAYCVHPDGSVGGVYGSRHTSLYFPAGMEWLADEIPRAAAIAHFLRERLARSNVVTLATTDAQNLCPLMISYLEAARAHRERPAPPALPCETFEGVRHFSDAGITVAGNPAYYAVVGGKKGGVCRIFDKRAGKPAYEDSGYLIRVRSRQFSSQWQGLGTVLPGQSTSEINCSAEFGEVRPLVPTPGRFLLLRLLSLTLFRSPALGQWLRKRIVWQLILARKRGPFRLRRRVEFLPEQVRFTDRLEKTAPAEVEEVLLPRAFTAIHMGSAKYFHPSELEATQQAPVAGLAREWNAQGAAQNCFQIEFTAQAAKQPFVPTVPEDMIKR